MSAKTMPLIIAC